MYATPTDMLSFGAEELAHLTAPDNRRVNGDLLRLTIEGGDRSGYSAEDIAAADKALKRLDEVLADASRRIDSYLAPRYRLPLSADLVEHSDLKQACQDVARWLLFDDAPTEAVTDRYDRTIAWLRDLSSGRASLGRDDMVATPPGRPVLRQSVSRIDWETF